VPSRNRRKYVKVNQSMQSFLQPLPTDKLIWLAKAALDEVALREDLDRLNRKPTPAEPRALQLHGKTLR
jgi:hypothetical protein